MILPGKEPVMVAKLLFERFEFGARKLVLFKRLKHSAWNSMRDFSRLSGKSF
jgi:hypothetical protein